MARAKRARKTSENEGNVVQNENSGYEQFREQRIKENMERMQKLGILDLSQNLKKSHTKPKPNPTPRNPSDKKTHNPLPLSGSPRRSTRFFLFLFWVFFKFEPCLVGGKMRKRNGKWKKVFVFDFVGVFINLSKSSKFERNMSRKQLLYCLLLAFLCMLSSSYVWLLRKWRERKEWKFCVLLCLCYPLHSSGYFMFCGLAFDWLMRIWGKIKREGTCLCVQYCFCP